ncbi:EamA family transporter RarD [Reinekea sp.]|jgi:chloramphenicol-sensitive protein RarD|uniref:EamA family transporter RarD n=1 Tax=Reinekea sp. TaxID=1970455 RepID=UPI003989DFA2
MLSNQKQGVIFALFAYTFWAFAPIYFKTMDAVPALEILTHRVIWSLIITLMIIALTKRGPALIMAMKSSKTRRYLLLTTLLIGGNWGVFIWAVNDNRLLEASLGYYINPLINIILGMFFFAERLDRPQKIAAFLCLIAVGFELIQFGKIPWVALFLATSFAFYGFFRKKLGVDSFVGMALETALLLPFVLILFIWVPSSTLNIANNSLNLNLLLFLAGPITMIPLLCFAAAANRLSLTALGFFQYIGPSGMFLLAVFIYDEPLSTEKLITFAIIWCALALLIWDNIMKVKHRRGAIKQK